jgi:DNA-binding SARP family transcriptional activator/tetratricopeptide (TPR) repeat protein
LSYPVLHIQFFGGFKIIFNDSPVLGVNSLRVQSLLAYLVLHANAPQSRQHLAFQLWSDATESQARNNLRQFIYQLRHALPDPDRFFVADASTVYWKTDDRQEIDIHRFEFTLREASAAEKSGETENMRHCLQEALDYYRGDLLPSCYDDWIAPERERLRRQFIIACLKLVHLHESQREYKAALHVAQRLLPLDPLDEDTYVTLIRLHGLNEDFSGARRIFKIAAETLKRELGVEPGEPLQSAVKRLEYLPRSLTSISAGNTFNASFRLVGRQVEWQALQSAWQRATNGEAHLLLITGEAGIGKSRLAEELFGWASRQGFAAAYTRSYGAEGRLSLAPASEWLRNNAIRPLLSKLDPVWLTEIARLMPELLGENAGLASPEPISEYGRRQLFFEALARGILCAPRPLLLWIDDLQWCDQETLDWLHFLLRFEPQNSLLILGTARSEESPPDHPVSLLARQLRVENKITTLELSPLDAAETAKLASEVRGQNLNDNETIRLYSQTEGNPLFVVETVRAYLTGSITEETSGLDAAPMYESRLLPPRVHAVIVGRLVQLSPQARRLAEIGAAIGRAFTLDLLIHAGHENIEAVTAALDELWQKRIIREQTLNVFDFTHDKLREVTYSETSLPQRRLLHRHIAQALELLYADELDPISSQVAAHYEQAGLFEQAVPYYQQAGSVAAGIYANEDAINLFNRGLDLLNRLPISVKRDAQELELQLALATLYRISKGWASPEEERVMNRVMVLCEKVGSTEQLIRTLFGLQTLYVVQAKYEKVEHTYRQVEKLFWQTQGSSPPPFVAINLAGARLFMGQLVEASKLFDSVIAIRDEKRIRDLQESQGLNYLVHGLAWNSHVQWCMGYPQAALGGAESAVAFSREFAQPFNQALAITYLTMLQVWLASPEDFHELAEESYAITSEYKAMYYQAWANILLCFSRALQQSNTENLNQLNRAIEAFSGTGAHVRLPVYYSLLAEACLRAGRFEAGLDALEKGLSEAMQNNEHWWDAEIYRLRGELFWAQKANARDIESIFQHSLEIARGQEAKSLELRAATSLARLLQTTDRIKEAKQCLTQVYDWFTEGFDTPDLESARALITQL